MPNAKFVHTTYCKGDGCALFSVCRVALTQQVFDAAKEYFKTGVPPINTYPVPKSLPCYRHPELRTLRSRIEIKSKLMTLGDKIRIEEANSQNIGS